MTDSRAVSTKDNYADVFSVTSAAMSTALHTVWTAVADQNSMTTAIANTTTVTSLPAVVDTWISFAYPITS